MSLEALYQKLNNHSQELRDIISEIETFHNESKDQTTKQNLSLSLRILDRTASNIEKEADEVRSADIPF